MDRQGVKRRREQLYSTNVTTWVFLAGIVIVWKSETTTFANAWEEAKVFVGFAGSSLLRKEEGSN